MVPRILSGHLPVESIEFPAQDSRRLDLDAARGILLSSAIGAALWLLLTVAWWQ